MKLVRTFLSFVAFPLALLTQQASAESARFVCSDAGTADHKSLYFDLHDNFVVQVRRVRKGLGKVHFVHDDWGDAMCPSASKKCIEPSYLTGGDVVITTGVKGAYICAIYVDPKTGRVANNYLPLAALVKVPEWPVEKADWAGLWRRREHDVAGKDSDAMQIKIKALGNAKYSIHGGSAYPEPPGVETRRNALITEYEVVVTPTKGEMKFAVGEDGNAAPYELVRGKNNNNCQIQMKRLGPYLVEADDQIGCGDGPTLFGVYRREE